MPNSLSQGAGQWSRRSWIGALSCGLATAQRPPRQSYRWQPEARTLPDLIQEYRADLRALEAFYPHTYAASRWSTLGEFQRAWLAGMEALQFETLDIDGRIDWLLLRNHIQRELAALAQDEARWREMEALVAFAPALFRLEDERQRVDRIEGKITAGVLVNVTRQVQELDNWLTKSGTAKPNAAVALRAHRLTMELAGNLKRWFAFYQGYDPVLEWWLKDPVVKLGSALDHYAVTLRERGAGLKKDDKDTIIGDPVGREAIVSDLKLEMIAYSPEELLQIADREFAWCENELRKATREMGLGDDTKTAIERVKNLHREPGGQPELILNLAKEAIDFVTARNLVTVPPLARDSWRMLMMSPERQRVNPFFLGGESIIVSYPTDAMTHEEKLMSMRGNNEHFARATVHHELIPGHNLQRYYNQRHRSYRSLFETPFWREGWALWWEMLLWDLGFARNAEDKIGMLFWRMHRCARIVFSLRFHLGEMTAQACVDFLVDRVGHERENAAAEVRRSFEGAYPPLYQAAYMLGGLQMRALYNELVQQGGMKAVDFHDRILKGNTMPVELVRASLTGTKPGKDFRPNWRF